MDRRESVKRVALLMGGTISATTLTFIMNSCSTPSKETETIGRLFSADEQTLIGELAETIIPKTDTPGAKEAQVPGFISMMIEECYPEDFQQHFKKGLNGLDKQCQGQFKKPFAELNEEQRGQILTDIEAAAFEPGNGSGDEKPHYYRTFKELTMLGFFTSETGASDTLEYLAIPGRYDGCIDLEPDQKTWAT